MVSIQLYDVPDEWVQNANERDISTTEYCQRMIHAGRRQFGHDYEPSETPATPKTLKLDESTGSEVEAQLKEWIRANLSTDRAQDINDLVALLEDDFTDLMSELLDEERAKYDPSKGGYLKLTDD
jgi:hypothetical protein